MINQYLKTVGVLAIFAIFYFVYQLGYDHAETQYRAEMDKLATVQTEQARIASEQYQAEKQKLETELRERNEKIDKIIEQNSIYRSRCFDDDGLRELQRAIKPKLAI